MNAPLDWGRIRRDVISRFSLSEVAIRSGVKLMKKGAEWIACCPFHDDRTPSFYIYDDDRRFKCFSAICAAHGDVLDFLKRAHGLGPIEALRALNGGSLGEIAVRQPCAAEPKSDRRDEAIAIWRAAGPIQGTPAETYLRSRGITCRLPDSLRFTRLPYGSRGALYPALVALIASTDNRAIGIQRTYLNASGTGKAAIPKPKLSLGHVRGGAIRLAPCAAELVITEGLEDGLTLQQELGLATWVAAGGGMMHNMRFPAGVNSIVIGADGDAPGEVAARKTAETLTQVGKRVRIIRPADGFKDFNDELRRMRT